MKRAISLVLVFIVCVSLCACGNSAEFERIISEKDRKLEEFGKIIDEKNQMIEELNNTIAEKDAILSEYNNIIIDIKNQNYDVVIEQLEQKKEEVRLEELKARGVEEISITIDNWAQYFEYTPNSYVYIKNAFGEVDVIQCTGGIKLKEEYTFADGNGTDVNFEIIGCREIWKCVVDFETGIVEFVEAISVSETQKTYTTSYDEYDWMNGGNGIAGYGQGAQAHRGDKKSETCEIFVTNLTEMLRAEGMLYIYKE